MLINTVCPACSKKFSVHHSRLEKTEQPCCSRSCAAKNRAPNRLTHGHCAGSKSKEFRAWRNMVVRCYFKASKSYARYGGRGITVCSRWKDSFENFLEDVGLAPSPDHTIGRIDNDGNYELGNIEWQLRKPQCNNRSSNHLVTALGRTQTLQQWADEMEIGSCTILARLHSGWTPEDSVSKPRRFRTSGEDRMLTFRGKTMNIADWSRETGIKASTIQRRVAHGWPDENALSTNPLSYHKRSY